MKLQVKTQRKSAFYIFALALLCAVVFGYGVGWLPLVGPDEPRYAEVAREMYESGDWITPHLGGINWFEKPALLYWLVAASYKLCGISELTTRLSIVLLATAGVFLLYFFGMQVRGPRYGYLSAMVLATMGLWVGFARGATFDLPLAVTIELGLLSFFYWDNNLITAKRSDLGWWLCAFALGLAILAKGLVGMIIPGAIIGLYLILTRPPSSLPLKPRLLIFGALIFLATASTWYLPMFLKHGREFINEFFIAHHFQRYLTDQYRHPQPVYFFFFVVLAGSFPWAAYLIATGIKDGRRMRTLMTVPAYRLRLFLWLWVAIPIIFFSFSGSKLPGYILPVFPALALLIGQELEELKERPKWTEFFTALLILAAALGVWWQGSSQLGLTNHSAITVASTILVVGGFYLIIGCRYGSQASTRLLPLGLAIIVIVAAHLIFPSLGMRESIRDLAMLARQSAKPEERLVFYLDNHPGINFYATDLPLRNARADLVTLKHGDELETLLAERKFESLLVMAYQRWGSGLTANERLQTEVIGKQSRNLRCSPQCDWILLRVRRR